MGDKLNADTSQLVVAHMEFARRLAAKFYRQGRYIGFEREDFEGAALLGLCDAARRFDKKKGLNFQTFAYFRVRGSIYDLLRKGSGISRRCFHQMVKPKTEEKVPAEEPPLGYAFARTLTDLSYLATLIENIGIELHLSPDSDVVDLSYADDPSPEVRSGLRIMHGYLRKIIDQLPDDQRLVIEERYWKGHTFERIRESFGGASKSWVSRLHVEALDSLRILIGADEDSCAKRVDDEMRRAAL